MSNKVNEIDEADDESCEDGTGTSCDMVEGKVSEDNKKDNRTLHYVDESPLSERHGGTLLEVVRKVRI